MEKLSIADWYFSKKNFFVNTERYKFIFKIQYKTCAKHEKQNQN